MNLQAVQRLTDSMARTVRAMHSLRPSSAIRHFLLRTGLSVHLRNGAKFSHRGMIDRAVMTNFSHEIYDIVPVDQRPFQRILDLGANIGTMTVILAERHRNARVLAVEPDPGNFEVLRRNTQRFGERVRPMNVGVWWRSAYLEVVSQGGPESFRVIETSRSGIPAMTVSSLFDELGEGDIDHMKMDIEGAEFCLFDTGRADWLPRVRSFAVEFHDRKQPRCMQAFFASLQAFGLEYEIHPFGEYLVGVRSGAGLKVQQRLGL